jgi:hypothetical protein
MKKIFNALLLWVIALSTWAQTVLPLIKRRQTHEKPMAKTIPIP